MAFESLTKRLQDAMSKLRRKGKVTEADVKEMMREIRLALLEADVNLQVVKKCSRAGSWGRSFRKLIPSATSRENR